MKALAFPHGMKRGSETQYTFNTDRAFCYCWVSTKSTDNTAISIVITTRTLKPFVFRSFLKRCRSTCSDLQIDSPRDQHTYIFSLLKTAQERADGWTIEFPTQDAVIIPKSTVLYCNNCNVIGNEIEAIWEAVLTNKKVLFIANTPGVASEAVVQTLSLFNLLGFQQKFSLFSQMGDPNTHLLNTFSIVGTTNRSMDRSGFDLVVRVSRNTDIDFTSETQSLRRRLEKLIDDFSSLCRKQLMRDPYFELVERKIPADRVHKKSQEVVIQAQSTDTFRAWRARNLDLEVQRSSFLSVLPREAVATLTEGELPLALDRLKKLRETAHKDEHYRAVIDAHISLITKRMFVK